jgi:hypothetical protein
VDKLVISQEFKKQDNFKISYFLFSSVSDYSSRFNREEGFADNMAVPRIRSLSVDVVSYSTDFCCGDFSFYSWDGVRLSPIGTPVTIGPVVSLPNDHDR